MSEDLIIASTDEPGVDTPPNLDETAFLRAVRRRSLARSVLAAVVVVVVACGVLLGGMVWWEHRLQDESTRIFGYYPWLIELTRPNTISSAGPEQYSSVFGSTDRYGVARAVGERAVAADVVSVEYDVWGGEMSLGNGGGFYLGTRRFVGSQAVPDLAFFHPSALAKARSDAGSEAGGYLSQYDAESAESIERLGAMDASCTAELAVSFDRSLSLEELTVLLPDDVRLSWGALDVWPAGEAPIAAEAGHILGAPFWFAYGPFGPEGTTLEDVEKMVVDTLRIIAKKAPEGTATLATRSADHLETNGFAYYGAVVTGPPAALRELAENERVTTVMSGLVVQPGE